MITLRPYQASAVGAIIKGFGEFRRQLRVCPTGGGKTIELAALAEHYQPGKTLILAHREELLEQTKDKISAVTGIVAEIEAAERVASLQAPVVVASVQTLMRTSRRQRWPANHFKLVVVDEAHHVLADSYQRVLAHFEGNGTKVLGCSATPDRGDKRLLADYFENVAHEVGLVGLIKDGYLSRIRVRTIPLRIDLSGVRTIAGDYSCDEVGHVIEPYLEQIADIIALEFSRRKSLVFLPLVALSERFAALCRERGIAAEHVDGGSRDRAGVLKRFRSGETTLVSNAMLWVEGFDEPSIDCVIPLRPTKIRSLFSQQVGRGMRVHLGKDHLLVLDFLWISRRHNIVGPADLVAADEGQAQEIKRQLSISCADGLDGDLLGAMSAATAQRLRKLAFELEENRRRRSEEVDLLELATTLGDPDLASWEPTMRWHRDAPTQGQLDALEKFGVRGSGIRSKGHASALLGQLIERSNRRLASYKQVRLLRKFDIPNPHLLSLAQASNTISELIGRSPKSKRPLQSRPPPIEVMRPSPIESSSGAGLGPPPKKEAALGGAALTRIWSSGPTIHTPRKRARLKAPPEDRTAIAEAIAQVLDQCLANLKLPRFGGQGRRRYRRKNCKHAFDPSHL